MTKIKLQQLKMIAEDARNDAYSLDGMEFNGKTVGKMFGNIFASINTLSEILSDVIKEK